MKNMAASGRGNFLYMYIVKTCEHSRSHIFGPIFMKFGQNICFLDMRVEFENGSGLLKNMVARGTRSFPYIYIVKRLVNNHELRSCNMRDNSSKYCI